MEDKQALLFLGGKVETNPIRNVFDGGVEPPSPHVDNFRRWGEIGGFIKRNHHRPCQGRTVHLGWSPLGRFNFFIMFIVDNEINIELFN